MARSVERKRSSSWRAKVVLVVSVVEVVLEVVLVLEEDQSP